MSNQVLRVTLDDSDPLIADKVLGQIFINADTGSVDYIDSDGIGEHIAIFDPSCTTTLYMEKSVYDGNGNDVVDNSEALGGIPANQWATQAWVLANATGNMEKSVYDTNDNGVVDDSERLGNQLPAYYLDYANFTNKPNLLDWADCSPTPLTSGDVIEYNGAAWVNKSVLDLGTF
jgi:hypothetical protein